MCAFVPPPSTKATQLTRLCHIPVTQVTHRSCAEYQGLDKVETRGPNRSSVGRKTGPRDSWDFQPPPLKKGGTYGWLSNRAQGVQRAQIAASRPRSVATAAADLTAKAKEDATPERTPGRASGTLQQGFTSDPRLAAPKLGLCKPTIRPVRSTRGDTARASNVRVTPPRGRFEAVDNHRIC